MLNTFGKNLQLLGFLTLIAGVSACTSSPSGPPKNPICKASAPPVSMELGKASRKIGVTPEGKVEVAIGDYAYQSSQYYYHDYDRDIMFQIEHKKADDGTESVAFLCVGGSGFSSNMPQFSVDVISDMSVQPDGIALVTKRKVIVEIDSKLVGGAKISADEAQPPTKILISKIYEDFAVAEQNVYDFTAGTIEARARLDEVPEEKGKKKLTGVERWTNTSMKLVDLNAPADK